MYTAKRGRPTLVAEPWLLIGQMVKRCSRRRVVGVIERVAAGTEEAIRRVLEVTGTDECIITAYFERPNATFRPYLRPRARRPVLSSTADSADAYLSGLNEGL